MARNIQNQMTVLLNYTGQLRLYSLADLFLLLVAIGSNRHELWGAIILHIGFLAYLESRHAHAYRAKVPRSISYLLAILGLVIFRRFEGLLYVLTSHLYTKKTRSLGWISPFFRGLQNFWIVAAIIGYSSYLPYLIGLILFARNLVGDMRDTEKDRAEGVKTVPVILGMKRSIKNIHLVATMVTSVTWWLLSTLSVSWLVIVLLIQLTTYRLTPR